MPTVTLQTRLPETSASFCEAMAELFGRMERSLYRDIQKGHKLTDLKREYQIKYGVNARFFNSVHISLQGKIKSREECHQLQIDDLKHRIAGLEEKIEKLQFRCDCAPACNIKRKLQGKRANLKFQIHQKKRKLAKLLSKLHRLESQKPSLIFGSRKLWSAQFNLEDNGYNSHKEWLKEWREARENQFFMVAAAPLARLSQPGNNAQRVQTRKPDVRIVSYLMTELYW